MFLLTLFNIPFPVKVQNSFSKSVPYANIFSYFVVKPRSIIIPNKYYFCRDRRGYHMSKY
jgi:hypothetical protein